MRRVLISIFLVILLSLPVRAMDFSAPPPPESAAQYLPKETDSFAQGLWNVLISASETFAPSLHEALGICVRIFAAVLIVSVAAQFPRGMASGVLELAGTAAVGTLLLGPSQSLINRGVETVTELREYGRLLIPVMASGLAARGGVSASTTLYVGTAVLDAVLSGVVTALVIPMLWLYLALAVGNAATGEAILGRFRDLIRWLMQWALKLTLYVFTGYMAVTGVVSGSADAAAAKAARIAVSGAVPVVGGILSEAADAVLLSASVLGSTAGLWGILTVLAIFCAPALRIGAQYLLLKLTAASCEAIAPMRCSELIGDFAGMLGLLMALVSTQMTLLLISAVCFLRGTGL